MYLLLINKNKRLNLLKDTIPQDIHENCINLAIYQDKLTSNKYLFKLTKYTENISSKLKLSIISSIILKKLNINNNTCDIITSFLVNPKSIITDYSVDITDMPQELEYIVSITKELNNEKSVKDVFLETDVSNNSKLIEILLLAPKLYDYLIDIGIKYGFMHNNLNLNNVIYDDVNNELLITDFSYSTFGKYFHNQTVDSEILAEVQNVLHKIDSSVYEGFTNDFNSDNRFSNKKTSNKYFGTIFDLISFTLNIYSYFIYYNINSKTYDNLIEKFKKILIINYNEKKDLIKNNNLKINIYTGNIDELIKYYNEIKIYIAENYTNDYYNLFIMILEGLFYANLFVTHKTDGFSEKFQIKMQHRVNEFSNYIDKILLNTGDAKKIEFINDNLSYLKHFTNSENTGGNSRKTSTKRILKKMLK